MSYRAGVTETAARMLSIAAGEPHFICDGCGATRGVGTKGCYAAQWFLNGRPPPGWRGLRMHDGSKRWDLCGKCWKAPAPTDGEEKEEGR